jgi:hypothetical protein
VGSDLTRLPDWRARFEIALDAIKSEPFAWGGVGSGRGIDCGPGLAGFVVQAVTGRDLAAPYRGRYRTARGAMMAMHRAGFGNLGDLVASMLPEIHPSQAKIGDIAAIPTHSRFGFGLGVVNGDRIFVVMPEGQGTVDLLTAARAFRVG